MTYQYQALFNGPHMEVDGVVTPITRDYWASQTLTTEDYALFKAAEYREKVMWDQLISSGQATLTKGPDDTTEVVLQQLVTHDPDFVTYMTQMLQDPAVTWPGPGVKPII